MEKDACIPLSGLRVDGGASDNNYLMQTQSDLLGTDVLRPACVETTALGAASLAGLACGFYEGHAKQNIAARFTPRIGEIERAERLNGWRRAVRCAVAWTES